MGVFKKINFGMKKTRDNLSGNIDNVLNAFEEIGDELYDELTGIQWGLRPDTRGWCYKVKVNG